MEPNKRQFNVLWWDFNRPTPSPYDVMPYFRWKYEELKKKDRPTTREQWRKFVESKGKYMFWSRCQYEIVVSQWPPTYRKVKPSREVEQVIKIIDNTLQLENVGVKDKEDLQKFKDILLENSREHIEHKVDVWDQIEPNVDLIVDILMAEQTADAAHTTK